MNEALALIEKIEQDTESVEFETSWGRVKCQDGDRVYFPRYFGDGIAAKIKGRKTFVTLTFDELPSAKFGRICEMLREALIALERSKEMRSTPVNHDAFAYIKSIFLRQDEALERIAEIAGRKG